MSDKRPTAEDVARDFLDQAGVDDAWSYSSGDVVALANFIAKTWQTEKYLADLQARAEQAERRAVFAEGERDGALALEMAGNRILDKYRANLIAMEERAERAERERDGLNRRLDEVRQDRRECEAEAAGLRKQVGWLTPSEVAADLDGHADNEIRTRLENAYQMITAWTNARDVLLAEWRRRTED